MLKKLSIPAKINITILIVFAIILATSVIHMVHTERALIENIIQQQNKDTADTYFDALNTMMLTGTMSQRQLLSTKIMEHPGVTEARMIRGSAISAIYGEGLPEEQIKDELDERALAGEQISQIRTIDGERILTVINPIPVTEDFRGTNCMTCHANAKVNDIVGAVRISYSLAELDAAVNQNLLESSVMHIIVFTLGMLLMVYMLRKTVCQPLGELRKTIEIVDQQADLQQQVIIFNSDDEIGQVGTAFNNMMKKFSDEFDYLGPDEFETAWRTEYETYEKLRKKFMK